ncbi:hypothetical protein ACILDU_11185 [Capnocytophaga canimorsus]|uniref:hypothetical protein n=1 Tax=Capnocytophaga canimorsus TaxID=28188 RepID=UPI0037D145E7
MKRMFFLILAVLGTTVQAQRQAGGWAVQAQGGIMSKGFTGTLGTSYTIGQRGFLTEAQMFYQKFDIDYVTQPIPYELYALELKGGYSYEKLHPLYIQLKLGAFGGLQNVNGGNREEQVYHSQLPYDVDGFTFGLLVNPELELVLLPKLSLLFAFTQYKNLASDYSKANFSATAGLKYYF